MVGIKLKREVLFDDYYVDLTAKEQNFIQSMQSKNS